MSREQASMKRLFDESKRLSNERIKAERSNEIALIKGFELSRDMERAELLKDLDRAELKDIQRAELKDIQRAELKDIQRSGLTNGNSGDGRSSTHHAAADIFQRASSLGGFMVAGMVVPMPPAAPSPNGYGSRVRASASNGDLEQREAVANRTVERMFEGSRRKWETAGQRTNSEDDPRMREALAPVRWVRLVLPLAVALGLVAMSSRARPPVPPVNGAQ
jgi:hypothetical protein